uniref:phage tail tip lysozyme n=1 Tax=Enterococcus faecalis TaxID=1351 RepID=UPI0022E3D1E5
GALQAWNGKTKIMELTRKGMGFWDGSSHVGNMGTKGNPFPLLNDANGNPVVTDGKSLLLVGNSPTNIIGLSNEESTGLIIRGATQWNLANNSYFIGKGGNKSTIYVDRLIVGGKEVIPKNAWAVWQFLKSKGYSEQAAAGILGNMDQESGIMPDIDEGGGGPGYGLVQWTSPIAG